MPRIQPLDRHVAELIAAGEVVERPASVVKELVENSVDAGATAVVVSIRRGGMGMIRVTDDGCGVSMEDLPTAFLRHATSKLRSTEDLGRIGTLGFRGEALAAIAAVSRVEMVSRERGAETGAVLRAEGGVIGPAEPAGAPEGTSVTVLDLFYNTPARLKFMRKDSAETAAVGGLMQHLALSRPEISFRFLKDGTDALHTPGDGKLLSAIYAALGREFAASLIPAEGRGGETVVSGFITRPLQCRGSRSMQTFFVNGRFIKSQLLTAAVEEAYRNQMMKGKFPGCVLSVTLPPERVDVNVHPAKTQVKFAREHDVFEAVYHTALDALAAAGSPIPAPRQERLAAASRQDFFQSMDAKTWREQSGGQRTGGRGSGGYGAGGRGADRLSGSVRRDSGGAFRVRFSDSVPADAVPADTVPADAAPEEPLDDWGGGADVDMDMDRMPDMAAAVPPDRPEIWKAVPQVTPAAEPEPVQEALPDTDAAEAPWRIAGEVLRTYIVCEDGKGDVWLIDKHAAHERINFDRMQAAAEPPMRQRLLKPELVEPGREDAALLLEHRELLERFGFHCEDFGEGALLVREAPADLDPGDVGAVLEEFADHLRTGTSPEERRERMLRTMACKASIKGGWESGSAELRALVDRVQAGDVRFCPHGRPVAVRLTGGELERMFRRA